MALTYTLLSQDEQDDIVASALIEREREHFHYELNRLNYESMLITIKNEQLPDEWPEHLRTYKGVNGEQLANAIKDNDYTMATRLQFRDRVKLLLATTMTEQAKVETVHKALQERLLDGAKKDAAITRVREAKAARQK